MDSHQRNALDRHITGNYGEDQFSGGPVCASCGDLLGEEPQDCPNGGKCMWSETDCCADEGPCCQEIMTEEDREDVVEHCGHLRPVGSPLCTDCMLVLVMSLKRIAKMPCLSDLLGESDPDNPYGCGCACCLAKIALVASNQRETRKEE